MNILITSVGRRYYIVNYFKEALKAYNGKVFVCNSSSHTSAFHYADEAFVSPLIYDLTYVDFLLDLVKSKQITAVLSLFDADLPILATHRSRFSELGAQLIVSPLEIISICNDKWETYRFLRKYHFNAPKTYLHTIDVLEAIRVGEIVFPIIIKPRWGCGSIGIYEAETAEELIFFSKYVSKIIRNSYLNYESSKDPNKAVIYQEKLTGIEYGLDIINDLNCHYCNTVIRRKYALRSGETDIAQIEYNSDLEHVGKQLSYALKHMGNLDADLIYHNNKYYFIDLNNRFGGGYPFSHAAGVNLPLAIINWLSGDRSTQGGLLTPQQELLLCKDIIISNLT